ncbi:MAG: hypothetical protein JWP69_1582 [Flaviaesturariibacter sp.]|nr:hypothetical protein [Flaviaesturariibacter sp.]
MHLIANIGNAIVIIIFLAVLLPIGYLIGEWALSGFKDVEDKNIKKRNPLQVVFIVILGIIVIYLFLSLFKGCEDTSELDAPRGRF